MKKKNGGIKTKALHICPLQKQKPGKESASSGVWTHDVTSTADLKSAPFDLSGIDALWWETTRIF